MAARYERHASRRGELRQRRGTRSSGAGANHQRTPGRKRTGGVARDADQDTAPDGVGRRTGHFVPVAPRPRIAFHRRVLSGRRGIGAAGEPDCLPVSTGGASLARKSGPQRGQRGVMIDRQRVTAPANAARIALAGVIIAGGALAMAAQAAADPAVPPLPTPVPAPDGAPPPPGQPVYSADGPVGPLPPPPVGPPTVPEIQNPVYGAGQTPGKFGYLRDIWHSFHSGNPLEALTAPPEEAPGPPPGAGPA